MNSRAPERAVLKVIPRMDHHFNRFRTPQDAFRDVGGVVDEALAVEAMLAWLKDLGL